MKNHWRFFTVKKDPFRLRQKRLSLYIYIEEIPQKLEQCSASPCWSGLIHRIGSIQLGISKPRPGWWPALMVLLIHHFSKVYSIKMNNCYISFPEMGATGIFPKAFLLQWSIKYDFLWRYVFWLRQWHSGYATRIISSSFSAQNMSRLFTLA